MPHAYYEVKQPYGFKWKQNNIHDYGHGGDDDAPDASGNISLDPIVRSEELF